MSRGAYGGGYGQNAGPGSARAPPGVGAFSVQDASRPAYAQQPPGGYQPPTGGGFQPAQRRFGDGGYGGVGAGPGLSAPTGRGGDGGYGGLPPRAFERSSAFGTGPGDRGAMQDAAPRRGFADRHWRRRCAGATGRARRIRRARRRRVQPGERHHRRRVRVFRGRRAETWRLGVRQPQRELVAAGAAPEGARPTFSLEKFGITGDRRARPRGFLRGRHALLQPRGRRRELARTASPPGAGGAGDGGAARAQTRLLCTWARLTRSGSTPPPRRRRPTRSRKPRRWRRGGRPWRRRTQL